MPMPMPLHSRLPMSNLPPPPHIPHSRHLSYSLHLDNNIKSVMASSWRVLEQPPPPTLREILDAYKARGDGDREMLLAMLNAKTSEDQRLASVANLHRTMLDMYHLPHSQSVPPILHVPEGHHPQSYTHTPHPPSPPDSYPRSPHATVSHRLHHNHTYYDRQRTDSSSSNADMDRDRSALSSSSLQPRKRRRTSPSPPPHPHARPCPSQEAMSAHHRDLPPSPYSSASSAPSSSGSPRSRESMAINSLLLNQAGCEDDTLMRNTSSERTTTMLSRDR